MSYNPWRGLSAGTGEVQSFAATEAEGVPAAAAAVAGTAAAGTVAVVAAAGGAAAIVAALSAVAAATAAMAGIGVDRLDLLQPEPPTAQAGPTKSPKERVVTAAEIMLLLRALPHYETKRHTSYAK